MQTNDKNYQATFALDGVVTLILTLPCLNLYTKQTQGNTFIQNTMKIIIIGAGELGQLLAERLSNAKNDVIIIDSSKEGFARLHENFDVMTLTGDAADIKVMTLAGIQDADMLLAVSGDQASNILACQIAKHFGVQKVFCRLYSFDAFDETVGITPEFYGIDNAFSAPAECAEAILDATRRRILLEKVQFSHPDATMVTAEITAASPLRGMHIQNIPDQELLNNIRIAALVRENKLMIPRANTILYQNDKLYVAGSKDYVDAFIGYASGAPEIKSQLVIVAGATRIGELVARELINEGHEVRFIVKKKEQGEELLNRMPSGCLVVQGEVTDLEVLLEAGIAKCDTFISADEDDEKAILSCILAKRAGARKCIATTHKPEYISILPAMDVIDCGFNSTLVSINTIFRLMGESSFRIDSRLLAFQAYLTEFKIKRTSPLIGKKLHESKLPPSAVLAMIFRGSDFITPTGDTELLENDKVVAIVTPASEEQIKPYFG